MTVKQLAAHYLRFWHREAETWAPSANAPSELWQFLTALKTVTDRQMIYEGLRGLAEGTTNTAVPDFLPLVAWLHREPRAVAQCEAILGGKNAPKTMTTLLRNAYLAEVAAAKDLVRAFIQVQLDKY